MPGVVQMVLGVWIPGKGWLTTKRGNIYGGRHGEPPLITDDLAELETQMQLSLRAGLRAMKHRIDQE